MPDSTSMDEFNKGATIIFCMLLFYNCAGTIIEKYKLSFGHEAGFTIILGKLYPPFCFVPNLLFLFLFI